MKHYTRWRRHGDPLIVKTIHGQDEVRFLSRIAEQPDGCWRWTGAVSDVGYGQLSINGRLTYAHRWAYEHWRGPIPTGYEIDHECHNRSNCRGGNGCLHRRCVNPAHLELAAPNGENAKRSPNALANRTHCPQGHPYDAENTYVTKAGSRGCRTCHRIKVRAYKARERARAKAVSETR